MNEAAVRAHLRRVLDWEDAHVGFDAAVKGLPPRLRGAVAQGLPHSPWQLVEHVRIAQADILEFCAGPKYKAKKWPDDYWPRGAAPPNSTAWQQSIAAFRRDRTAMRLCARSCSPQITRRITWDSWFWFDVRLEHGRRKRSQCAYSSEMSLFV